ncbi:MAG: hypothetical protein WBS24_11300 [Terriglobales bacterium]
METEKSTLLAPSPLTELSEPLTAQTPSSSFVPASSVPASSVQASTVQTSSAVLASAPSSVGQTSSGQSIDKTLQGSVLVLIQFDVSEEIRLDALRDIFGARRQEASFKHPAPGYVRYQRPPVVERVEPLVLESGERLDTQIKYYDYGVLSVVFELPFTGDWDTLVRLASRWVWDTDFTSFAQKIVKQKLERALPALVKPYDEWLTEDYFVFHVRDITGNPAAEQLLAAERGRIAQIVRGETVPLSEGECQEVLQSRISYYPSDLTVIGWNAAFLYDSQTGADTAIQLLEYANSQLLEFRHYDELLTRELQSVYEFMDHKTGIWARWRTAKRATRLHTVLLDVDELTERADNAIKFLSDMFSARLYKVAASKIGVTDYKDLVNQKVHTAEELYRFMVEQFHQSRAFVLEFLVVIILIIELFWLFKGSLRI